MALWSTKGGVTWANARWSRRCRSW